MAIRQWHAQGRLNPTQGLLMRATRPAEELYDLANDPHEIHSLADQTAFHSTLVQMREALNQWMTETQDQGREPESAAMYESDMAVYLQKHRDKGDLERLKILQQNIQWMQEQAAGNDEPSKKENTRALWGVQSRGRTFSMLNISCDETFLLQYPFPIASPRFPQDSCSFDQPWF